MEGLRGMGWEGRQNDPYFIMCVGEKTNFFIFIYFPFHFIIWEKIRYSTHFRFEISRFGDQVD